MLIAPFISRNLLMRTSLRAYSSSVKSRVVKPEEPASTCTRSREEFERVYPKLAAKQEHHMRMLRDMKLPVHRSGPHDDTINGITYAASVLLLIFSIYLLYQLV